MKPFIFIFLFCLSGCTRSFYFSTPNDVFKMKGTLVLNNGERITGDITVPLEDSYNVSIFGRQSVEITPENKNTAEFKLSDIRGYYMDTSFYVLKRVYVFTDHAEHLLFVKRLTGEHSKIQLYYLHQNGKSSSDGEETDDYFISLAGSTQYEAINTKTSKIVPDFDIKMSALVEDCPSLAKKIRLREPGYFLPFVAFDRYKHRDVFMKIINEYNNCK